jgi:hypothetical protein
MTTSALAEVYRGLKVIGLSKSQVSAILPEWWDPSVATSESGLLETAVLLGRRLSLDAGALLQGRIELAHGVSNPRFKHTVRVTPEQLAPATLIAASLAKAILGATPIRDVSLPQSALIVRDQILSSPDGRIDFDSLLQFCWRIGVPVIPLPHLPKGVRKMDAAAIKVGARPAIIIALRNNSKAWLSFLLAHELGHLCLNHVPNDAAIIEGSIGDSTEFDAQSQADAQESEANAFAHALLGGPDIDAVISSWPSSAPHVTLAAMALKEAASLRTAPGHLVLRHAFRTHRWPEARTALNFLSEDFDAQSALIAKLAEEADTSIIGDDLQGYVEQITGVAAQN